mgnify:CR=1 FL=1
MKISIKTALTILFIAINTACSEDTEYRIDEGLNTETFETITPMTMQMNSQATGAVISDEIYDYYRYLDGNSLMLYKKNRKSGKTTTLVTYPWSEEQTGEVLLSDLYLKDNYLYFVLFDYNAGMVNVWCRVPVDGSAPYKQLRAFGNLYSGLYFDGDKVYVVRYGERNNPKTLNLMQVETGEFSHVYEIPDNLDPRFFYGGYLYGCNYKRIDDVFHTQICRWALDTPELELVWDTDEIPVCIAHDSKLYVSLFETGRLFEMDLDGKNPNLLLKYNGLSLSNIHNGVLYFRIMQNNLLQTGIYRYTPGDKMPFPVYLSDNIAFESMITGTGDIWFTTEIEGSKFRFGQVGYVDRYNKYHAL